ncbi:MAG: hypothetical protein V2J51_11675 [Erythrobacter sp.]|jgi:hypothetical protein|nr:hypothetical protein [Erythrobacter sp.]
MRHVLILLAGILCIGATDAPGDGASPETPDAPRAETDAAKNPTGRECRDRIERARAASGQPLLLNRGPATPDDPVLIYAVDRRQDGCSVMVVAGNPDDIRALPEKPENGKLLWRAVPSQ